MPTSNPLGEMLSTLFDRRPFVRKVEDSRPINELCRKLLSEETEVFSRQLATTALAKYRELGHDEKVEFFLFLNDELDVDAGTLTRLAAKYGEDPTPKNFKALSKASEPRRQELFRRLNEAPNATAELVNMRADLLKHLKTKPELGRTDHDLVHLFKSWFNRGFLVLRQINWDSSASILEKIIAYEAVHEIRTWDDLRRRLHPADRRCFAFFHPAMPDDPLIFVEVALTKGVPNSIQGVLTNDRELLTDTEVDTAVFYSISNCQNGLAGISFGNSLIKQVAGDLSIELPILKTFVTISPIPGLVRWLEKEGLSESIADQENLQQLAARYLFNAKTPSGKPLDPVARFHLGNGALIHAVHTDADMSENGMKQSRGAMVNYLYDLPRIPQNLQLLANKKEVAAASSVKSLAKQAAKYIKVNKPAET